MPRKVNEDVSRLPKWAQSRIKVLEQRLAGCKNDLRAIIGGHDETNTSLVRFVDMQDLPLPNNTRVKFILQQGEIEIDASKGYLYVYASSLGLGGELVVAPSVSNVVQIHLLPRGTLR